jgi:hypothetical protein
MVMMGIIEIWIPSVSLELLKSTSTMGVLSMVSLCISTIMVVRKAPDFGGWRRRTF